MKVAYIMLGIGVILLFVGKARHQTDYYDRPAEAYDPSTTNS